MPTPEYIEIPLTRGQVTRISPCKLAKALTKKWCAYRNPSTGAFYAVSSEKAGVNRWRTIYMHRFLLGLEYGDPRKGDHIKSDDTLNNTDENIRIVNDSQSVWNTRKQKNNKTGFKGVSYDRSRDTYTAHICVNKKQINLGRRKTAEAAYRELYVPAALRLHGEFANLE